MRNIIFRAKDRINEKWNFGYLTYINALGFGMSIKNQITGVTYPIYPESVGQFIGLYDIYGNEIYEGDIVQLEDIYDYTEDCFYNNIRQRCGNRIIKLVKYMSFIKYSRGIVYYKSPEFRIKDIKIKESNCYNFYSYEGEMFSWGNLKVIGNIHDNPELLEIRMF